MKKVKRPTVVILYNLSLMVIFFVVYLLLAGHFATTDKQKPDLVDILTLSVTLQTAVGYTNLIPITSVGKLIVLVQQILLIFGNVIILHFMVV